MTREDFHFGKKNVVSVQCFKNNDAPRDIERMHSYSPAINNDAIWLELVPR